MGLWSRIAGEFVDVIQWLDDSSDTMVWRFERRDQAIKYGAKLTVREGQSAVFVNEGQVADVFGPGMYELFTANLPILSTLQAWPHGFESPFKADVYFFSTRRFGTAGDGRGSGSFRNAGRTIERVGSPGGSAEAGAGSGSFRASAGGSCLRRRSSRKVRETSRPSWAW